MKTVKLMFAKRCKF